MRLIREDASASQTAAGPVVGEYDGEGQPIRSQWSGNKGQGVKSDRPKKVTKDFKKRCKKEGDVFIFLIMSVK